MTSAGVQVARAFIALNSTQNTHRKALEQVTAEHRAIVGVHAVAGEDVLEFLRRAFR